MNTEIMTLKNYVENRDNGNLKNIESLSHAGRKILGIGNNKNGYYKVCFLNDNKDYTLEERILVKVDFK